MLYVAPLDPLYLVVLVLLDTLAGVNSGGSHNVRCCVVWGYVCGVSIVTMFCHWRMVIGCASILASAWAIVSIAAASGMVVAGELAGCAGPGALCAHRACAAWRALCVRCSSVRCNAARTPPSE
jgi:hypothetical protein